MSATQILATLLVLGFIPAVLFFVKRPKQTSGDVQTGGEFWRALFQSQREAQILVDATNGSILFANDAARSLLGNVEGRLLESLGHAAGELIHRKSPGSVNSPDPIRADLTVPGSSRQISLTATSLDICKKRHLLVTIHDVTDFYQNPETAFGILQAMPDNVYVFGQDLRYEFVSPSAASIPGKTSAQMIGKTWQELGLSANVMRPFEEKLKAVFQSGIPDRGEVETETGQRGLRYSYQLVPLPDHKGEIRRVLCTAHDITAHENSLREVRRLNSEHERDAHFRDALFAALPIAVFCKDTEGRYISCNEAFCECVGFGEADLRGRTALEIWPTNNVKAFHERDRELIQRGGMQVYEGKILNAQKKKRSVIFNKSVFRDGDGRIAGVIGCFVDITDQKELEDALRGAKAQAEESSRAKSAFLAAMSHEIRTPLNGVVGFSALLLETPLNAEQTDYADSVRNSAESLLSIVNDILDFSKIEAGKIDMEEMSFDLREAVESCLDLVTPLANRKKIELCAFVEEACPDYIVGDVTRLRQVLSNLLSNAVKFTESGEVALTVDLPDTGPDNDPALRIQIRDTGIGMSPGQQRRIFEPFTQGDASMTRRFGGTGLGLAISKRLVGLMGGLISVDSTPGKGSTFSFTLPLRTDLTFSPSPLNAPRTPLTGLSIAAVDDHATNRLFIARQVGSWGAKLLAFDSAEQFLEAVKTGTRCDFVLMDYNMPRMNGLVATQALKAIPGCERLPVVLLSSETVTSHDFPPGLFVRIFSKPFNARALRDALISLKNNVIGDANPPQDFARMAVTHPLRILLAEDNPSNQKLGVLMLKKFGYLPDVASNGAEAVESVRSKHYDVILMDVQMPEMDGLDATRAIRHAFPRDHQPWIIALTAHAAETDRARCLEAGMNEYLTKPLRRDLLISALERASAAKK